MRKTTANLGVFGAVEGKLSMEVCKTTANLVVSGAVEGKLTYEGRNVRRLLTLVRLVL